MNRIWSVLATVGFGSLAGMVIISSAISGGTISIEIGLYAIAAWVTLLSVMGLTLAGPLMITQGAKR